ncbi:hypothetical protein [Staphylococcus carnosus]|uniref:hypothetical protein n=1 Tax=Staphylococcus carnosus TaxID=1281 RepID=UPI00081A9689|nr:hypothetical protein [Staphylococcus carnosus]ANZ33461.1 hypothetical protein BEK99_06490 [Staphylococcus carnosus]UTB80804.1 hypothetical protein A2I65_07875 [Staphylococcus carnosus]UTB85625.1 hypothetical protein A2I66_08095 [Staphylococcus carnosus]
MIKSKNEDLNVLVERLIEHTNHEIKFFGQTAKMLFLKNEFIIGEKTEICVKRRNLTKVLKYIPEGYKIRYFDTYGNTSDKLRDMKFSALTHLEIDKDDKNIMSIYVYDVHNDEWMFRFNHGIRLPEKHIYFHSLPWGVDYIKPEIVLMYELLRPGEYGTEESNKAVIDALSYYQFVILKVVVGEEKLHSALSVHY